MPTTPTTTRVGTSYRVSQPSPEGEHVAWVRKTQGISPSFGQWEVENLKGTTTGFFTKKEAVAAAVALFPVVGSMAVQQAEKVADLLAQAGWRVEVSETQNPFEPFEVTAGCWAYSPEWLPEVTTALFTWESLAQGKASKFQGGLVRMGTDSAPTDFETKEQMRTFIELAQALHRDHQKEN